MDTIEIIRTVLIVLLSLGMLGWCFAVLPVARKVETNDSAQQVHLKGLIIVLLIAVPAFIIYEILHEMDLI
jgi:hypothetical protein